jgi:hypothetical protein
MKKQYAFKVTSLHLQSVHISCDENLTIQYKMNEFVSAKVGKCFVFKTLKDATDWVYRYNGIPYSCRIFLAEIEDVEVPPSVIKNWTTTISEVGKYCSYFWSNYEYPQDVCPDTVSLHSGTLFAGRVKLLREMNKITKKFKKYVDVEKVKY